MLISNNMSTPLRNSYKNNNNTAAPSFGSAQPNAARKAFEWLGGQCNIQSNGSLTRAAFFAVGTLFMLGGRFVESRDNDERREVVTRDVPGVAIACFGAPLLNNASAYLVTKKTGIPIAELQGKDPSQKPSFMNARFVSQKQVVDWYSDLEKLDNPLVNFAETIERQNGNLKKVMKKFGFEKELNAISTASDNKTLVEAIKEGKAKNTAEFKKLEELLKNVSKDNKVLQFAKTAQASVKMGCILFSAALLGYFLPRLNIITTKNKYKKNPQTGEEQKVRPKYEPVATFSNGVSIHRSSAINTFRSFLG